MGSNEKNMDEIYKHRIPYNIKMNTKNRVISFSLWGNNPVYNIGAVENANRADKIFKDWTCRFYVSKDVPKEIVEVLKEKKNVEVVTVPHDSDWRGTLWRLFVLDDPKVDVAIFRDTDSRITFRDYYAVEDWMRTGQQIHIMRDHPFNNPSPISGGMWGCVANKFRWLPAEARNYISSFDSVMLTQEEVLRLQEEGRPILSDTTTTEIKKNLDQKFLNKVYLNYQSLCYVHDSFPHFNPWSCRNFQTGKVKEVSTGFPVVRNFHNDHENKWNDFIGQQYDEKNNPNEELSSALEKVENDITNITSEVLKNKEKNN